MTTKPSRGPGAGAPPNAFISHNSSDKDVARDVGVFLTASDVSVWFDEWEIAPGESVSGRVDEGLASATHFILVWSEHAAASNWVTEERRAAFARAVTSGSPALIVLRLDETDLPELLRDRKYIDWRRAKEDLDAVWGELLWGITGLRPEASFFQTLVGKYQSLLFREDAGRDPLPYRFCPRCGGTRFKRWMSYGARDHQYYHVECSDCGWTEFTE